MTDEAIVLNETIHQSTRLRIMTLLVMQLETDRLAYGFIQQTLNLTGGNLTIHLRKLEDADYLVITKEFLRPAAAGLWTAGGAAIPRVTVGIVALGHVLFGIMHRPVIAAVGAGFAAAFYVPSYLVGDAALAVSGAATLIVVALGTAWIRRSGVL